MKVAIRVPQSRVDWNDVGVRRHVFQQHGIVGRLRLNGNYPCERIFIRVEQSGDSDVRPGINNRSGRERQSYVVCLTKQKIVEQRDVGCSDPDIDVYKRQTIVSPAFSEMSCSGCFPLTTSL